MGDKKICKIKDERLESYSKRTRSGSEQVFYTGSDERDFERYRAEGGTRNGGVEMHDKTDTIRLQPPERHYYAELIDGEWWWLNGCGECNGRERDWMTYVECDKHNVCRSCGTKRADLSDTPHGGKNGWQCKPCYDIEHEAEKKKALEKFASIDHDDWDFNYNDEVVCPHCGLSYQPDEMHEDTEVECDRCDGSYNVELEHSVKYSTEIIGKRVTA